MVHEYKVRDLTFDRDMQAPFIVATPRPYIVDLVGYGAIPATIEQQQEAKKRLIAHTAALRQFMARLAISEEEARQAELTLNEFSKDYLIKRAWEQSNHGIANQIRKAW